MSTTATPPSTRPPLHRNRSAPGTIHDPRAPAPRKQFVVVRHGAHHRVPSYGRNLNKLGGDHHHGNARDPSRTRKRHGPTFELGSDAGASDSSRPSSPGVEVEPMQGGGAVGRLVKSSSTRSLDGAARRTRKKVDRSGLHQVQLGGHRRSKSHDGKEIEKKKREEEEFLRRQREEEKEVREQQEREVELKQRKQQQREAELKQRQEQEEQEFGQRQRELHEQRRREEKRIREEQLRAHELKLQNTIPEMPASTPPHTPQPQQTLPQTPIHSLPSSHDLPTSSRFIPTVSPSNASLHAQHTQHTHLPPSPPPLTRSISSLSAPLTRTQQKLWLQRAAPLEPSSPTASQVSEFAGYVKMRQEKEFERVAREYRNVRRFRNPLAEGMVRAAQPVEARVFVGCA